MSPLGSKPAEWSFSLRPVIAPVFRPVLTSQMIADWSCDTVSTASPSTSKNASKIASECPARVCINLPDDLSQIRAVWILRSGQHQISIHAELRERLPWSALSEPKLSGQSLRQSLCPLVV